MKLTDRKAGISPHFVRPVNADAVFARSHSRTVPIRKGNLPFLSPNGTSGKAGSAVVRLGLLFPIVAALFVMMFSAQGQPVVSNVRAAQRAGNEVVDIYYDLSSASNAVMVSVAVSTNSGVTFGVPASSVSGDSGSGITPGTSKHIVWNAGADLVAPFYPNVKVRVTADDSSVPPPPPGMVLIPTGSFTMGNCMDPNEGYSGELPLHTVYVSAFYMDKYDVTLALWNSIYQWATNHGYSFDNPGLGKAANHPVQTVNWYDCVKWCNARSEMEGRIPVYYTDASQTVVYRSGDFDISNSCVNWNSGYRLPTEAEWEKAARGGLSGQRFPWGNTISWSQANYYSYWSGGAPIYSYDLAPTNGFDPAFNDGVYPGLYTSPVGYFAANGYGLYEMAGNVMQWCWDWYDDSWYANAGATQSDTRGPASSPYVGRVLRGGGWNTGADSARCADRDYNGPNSASYDSFGFRCVLPHSGLPVITVQPQNQRVDQLSYSAHFSVTAIGDPPLDYQWQLDGTNIVSATGPSLTLVTTNFQLGTYYISVVVSNGVGVATSQSAQLNVIHVGIGEQ